MDFKAKYKRNDYINFFRNYLLPEDFVDHSEEVSLTFKPQHISKVIKIGEVPPLELNIYEVAHPAENDPRVSLSRDAFRLLAQYGVRRALIVFNSETSSNFRLSLVTIDLKWEEGKRVQKEYSNPRRYSFFLGPETKTHTPEEYLIKQGRVKDFDDLKKRFSIEVVNKDFYTQIAVLFTQLAGGKRTIGRKSIDAGRGLLSLPSTVDDTLDKEFTVRLIGRLVFCWFLKKKRSDKNIPLLPDELLSAKAVSENKGYYHGVLEPLFFEVLNTPVDNREKKYQATPWPQIPFLNGGLFTPHQHDFYEPGLLGISKHINTLKVPDNWIKELFEVFETYNFTIDENTSVDVELSIEPEMLGRIFENLLAEINPETGETARKATGSYYTPRPIVEYMADESLKQYLLTKTKLDENQIKSLLTYEDLPIKLTESEKEAVLTALDVVKVIDPACGSGAFPMGILQKTLLILQKVDPESEWWLERMLSRIGNKALEKKLKVENVNYIHKLGIIQNAIFGVDIQPIAVEISKLRFFLSLIVDEKINDAKENRGIEPLPNLEFKFVCTNSLIGLPKNEKSPDQLFETEDTQSINELKELRNEYLRSYGSEKEKIQIKFLKIQKKMVEFYWKCKLKPQIDLSGNKREIKKQEEPEFTRMLSRWDPFSDEPAGWFDPEWMFGMKGGFDIVIANPPYVQIKQIPWNDRKVYEKKFNSAVGRFNLFYFFLELSTNLAAPSGVSTFIVPDRLLLNTQCDELRKWLLKQQTILEIDSFAEGVFDAIVDSIIIIYRNAVNNEENVKVKNRVTLDTLSQISTSNVPISYFLNSPNTQFDLSYQPLIAKLFGKIKLHSVPLGEISEIKDGIIQSKITDKLFLRTPLDQDSKKLLFGKNIGRYAIAFDNNWVNYKSEEMMAIEMKRVKGAPGLRLRKRAIFERLKILTRQTADEIIAAYDAQNHYYSNTLHGTTITNIEYHPLYVLALLNSRLMTWYYRRTTAEEGKVFAQIKIEILRLLPIFKTSLNEQKPFIGVVEKIHKIAKAKSRSNNDSEQQDLNVLIRQIDPMIYELYGLTNDEIGIIENSIKGK